MNSLRLTKSCHIKGEMWKRVYFPHRQQTTRRTVSWSDIVCCNRLHCGKIMRNSVLTSDRLFRVDLLGRRRTSLKSNLMSLSIRGIAATFQSLRDEKIPGGTTSAAPDGRVASGCRRERLGAGFPLSRENFVPWIWNLLELLLSFCL